MVAKRDEEGSVSEFIRVVLRAVTAAAVGWLILMLAIVTYAGKPVG